MSLFGLPGDPNASLNGLSQPFQQIQYGPGNGYRISVAELEALYSNPNVNIDGNQKLSPAELRALAQHSVPGAREFFQRLSVDEKLRDYIASKVNTDGSDGLTLNSLKRLAVNGYISKESINTLFPNDPYFVHITKDHAGYGFQDLLATPWIDETYVSDAPVTDFSLYPNLFDLNQFINPNLIGSSADPSNQNIDFNWNTFWQPGSWSNMLGSLANQPWMGPFTQFFRSS
jgi:hypothetical protein